MSKFMYRATPNRIVRQGNTVKTIRELSHRLFYLDPNCSWHDARDRTWTS